MLNYTERLTFLLQDIVSRVPALSFIDVADVLVFARSGRTNAEGAFATCHCLTLPASDPGYYFWKDRESGAITRRSEWFVTKSPRVAIGGRAIKYLISFSLPRFCDQRLDRSRKERFYPNADPWIAKVDTVIHELYHVDPSLTGIRRIQKDDGTYAAGCHAEPFFERVAELVHTYLDSQPSADACRFLKSDFSELQSAYGGIVGTTFRSFPSFPQRYTERLSEQLPCETDALGVPVEPLQPTRAQVCFSEDDLHLRQFMATASRRLIRKGAFRAA